MLNQLFKLITASVTVLLMLMAINANAQESATISVSGTVISGLTVDAEQDLLFGDIVAGESKRVNFDGTSTGSAPGGEQAGIFRINTLGSFTISFTDVPAAMIGTEDIAGQTLPISFFSAWSNNLTPPSGGANVVSITENTPVVVTPPVGDRVDVYVFLGAEVTPPASQAQGFYETTITLTATFGID